MSTPARVTAQIGKQVTVTNPHMQYTSWTGKLIGYRDHPCVTLEFENGEHMCLPADWVEPDTPPTPPNPNPPVAQ